MQFLASLNGSSRASGQLQRSHPKITELLRVAEIPNSEEPRKSWLEIEPGIWLFPTGLKRILLMPVYLSLYK